LKYLRFMDAIELLRMPGAFLMQMHTKKGLGYFVIPASHAARDGGRLKKDDAEKIIAAPDVIPDRNGLFPGITQSWRVG